MRIDLFNQSEVAIVVWVVSDRGALMQGFIPGGFGTITINLGAPDNGIGIEVFRATDCAHLVKGTQTFPTPQPFTLIVDGGPEAGTGVLTVEPQVAAVHFPLTQTAFHCSGG